MANGRKNQSAFERLVPVVKVVLFCLFLAGAGLGFVWQKNQIYALAQLKKQKEQRLEALRRDNKLHRDRLDYLRLPWVLEKRAKELNLGLAPPQPEQILRLPEPGKPMPATVAANRSWGERTLQGLAAR